MFLFATSMYYFNTNNIEQTSCIWDFRLSQRWRYLPFVLTAYDLGGKSHYIPLPVCCLQFSYGNGKKNVIILVFVCVPVPVHVWPLSTFLLGYRFSWNVFSKSVAFKDRKHLNFNSVQSVITKWRTRECVKCEWHQQHLLSVELWNVIRKIRRFSCDNFFVKRKITSSWQRRNVLSLELDSDW